MFSQVIQFNPIDQVTGKSLVSGSFIQVDNGTATTPVLHLAPGTPVPTGATVLMGDGTSKWSWGQFATAQPVLAQIVRPNEWYGESTAYDVTPALFPILKTP